MLALRELIEARLDGDSKILDSLQRQLDRRQSDIDASIVHITTLFDVKFQGVEKQFIERDKRTEQLSIADKTAIAAALQAQKEAAGAQNDSNAASVTKQEAAFTKLIDQTQQLLQVVSKSTDDKINDLKSRLDKGEGITSGHTVARVENRDAQTDVRAILFGSIGIGLGVASLVITSLLHFK